MFSFLKSLIFFLWFATSILICNAQEKQGKGFPIYADISIKKSIAEFNFFTIYREKSEGAEFGDILIDRIAVTNPKLNKASMKMIPKKLGIFYQVKIKQLKQKYTISFYHSNVKYEGVIELNPQVKNEISQLKFWRKV